MVGVDLDRARDGVLLHSADLHVPVLAEEQPDRQLLQPRELQRRSSTIRSSGRRSSSRSSCRSRRSWSACVLFVPTIYWVHLRLPKLRPVIAFMALVPFVVPADHPRRRAAQVLQGHAARTALVPRQPVLVPPRRLRDPRLPVRVLLARGRLPLDRRAHADGGVAQPRRGLADDARCASSFRTSGSPRSAPPSSRSRSSWASSRSRASRRSTRSRPTSSTSTRRKGYPASALTLLSFGITWLAMLSILLIGRKRATSGRFAAEVGH